eukprot:SAG22_NODE_3902_length_1476_cov_1.803922_1_plen_66_part_10
MLAGDAGSGNMPLAAALVLLAAQAAAAAADVIDVGAVRIQLCTPEIIRVQAAAPPAPPAAAATAAA